jgi:RNA polymerase sigma-70 factor (ECF subfamily)
LLQVQYSPVAALNRTYALSKVKGKQVAIRGSRKITIKPNNPYILLCWESSIWIGIIEKAKYYFNKAMDIAKTH